MSLNFPASLQKKTVFTAVEKFLADEGFKIVSSDNNRPWGGFFAIDESQAETFIKRFFLSLHPATVLTGNRISPKLLIIEPEKRLSWQYHHRRSEVWSVISKRVGIALSDSDDEKNIKEYKQNDVIIIKQRQRHRLIGLNTWGIIAEVWQHTDVNDPTDEEDIIRLQDDYGR